MVKKECKESKENEEAANESENSQNNAKESEDVEDASKENPQNSGQSGQASGQGSAQPSAQGSAQGSSQASGQVSAQGSAQVSKQASGQGSSQGSAHVSGQASGQLAAQASGQGSSSAKPSQDEGEDGGSQSKEASSAKVSKASKSNKSSNAMGDPQMLLKKSSNKKKDSSAVSSLTKTTKTSKVRGSSNIKKKSSKKSQTSSATKTGPSKQSKKGSTKSNNKKKKSDAKVSTGAYGSASSTPVGAAAAAAANPPGNSSATNSSPASGSSQAVTQTSSGKKRKKTKDKKTKKSKKVTKETFDSKEAPIEAMGLEKANAYNPEQEFDDRQIDFSVRLIKSNLARLEEIVPTLDSSDSEFKKYVFDRSKPLLDPLSKPIKPRSCMSLHPAIHTDFKTTSLVCKVYDAKVYNPKSNEYLKILRHISKKHPSILGTWDVFYDGKDVLVMQEFAGYGSLEQYISHFGALNESRAQESAKQSLRAMDYLGDFGLTHRCICPKHIMVCRTKTEWTVKLSGFQCTIIYWDAEKEDIKFQSCRPLKDAEKEVFQAPEVFGDPAKDVYDPIMADIFSFGSVIYFTLTKSSPNKSGKSNEIKNHIKKLDGSSSLKDILNKMLSLEAKARIPFEQMAKHSWLKEA